MFLALKIMISSKECQLLSNIMQFVVPVTVVFQRHYYSSIYSYATYTNTATNATTHINISTNINANTNTNISNNLVNANININTQ